MTFPVIDSHQHVWDLEAAHYGWLEGGDERINRSIDFDEVAPELAVAGVTATVLVQSADNAEDTQNMVRCAARNPQVVGIVGWVPLDRADEADQTLHDWRQGDLFVGVRNLIHDLPDPRWLLRPEVDEGLSVLEAHGIPFDLVAVLPEHLELIPTLVERHPRLKIVIDHLAKPPVGLADASTWQRLMRQASESPLVYGKVSGLYSATADLAAWSTEQIRPFVEDAFEYFGANRLMYGGDWPVSLLAGGYTKVWQGLHPLFAELNAADQEAVLGGTATAFYGLASSRIEAAQAAATTIR